MIKAFRQPGRPPTMLEFRFSLTAKRKNEKQAKAIALRFGDPGRRRAFHLGHGPIGSRAAR